eukprot:scaffold26562_cov18-Tisochrysis_lutea.AAC.5
MLARMAELLAQTRSCKRLCAQRPVARKLARVSGNEHAERCTCQGVELVTIIPDEKYESMQHIAKGLDVTLLSQKI